MAVRSARRWEAMSELRSSAHCIERGMNTLPRPSTNLLVALGALLIVWLLVGRNGSRPADPAPIQADKNRAEIRCQQFASEQLPAAQRTRARFPELTDPGEAIVDLGNGRWRLDGYVDTPEQYGGRPHTRYTCTVRAVGANHWQLEALQFAP